MWCARALETALVHRRRQVKACAQTPVCRLKGPSGSTRQSPSNRTAAICRQSAVASHHFGALAAIADSAGNEILSDAVIGQAGQGGDFGQSALLEPPDAQASWPGAAGRHRRSPHARRHPDPPPRPGPASGWTGRYAGFGNTFSVCIINGQRAPQCGRRFPRPSPRARRPGPDRRAAGQGPQKPGFSGRSVDTDAPPIGQGQVQTAPFHRIAQHTMRVSRVWGRRILAVVNLRRHQPCSGQPRPATGTAASHARRVREPQGPVNARFVRRRISAARARKMRTVIRSAFPASARPGRPARR